jgi:hypothetical protein
LKKTRFTIVASLLLFFGSFIAITIVTCDQPRLR